MTTTGTTTSQQATPGIGPAPALLLVEDHPDSLYLLARLLRRTGYTVFEAANCAQALDAATRVPVGVLVADINLPDCSGHELLRQLRTRAPGLRALALSAHTSAAERDAAREAGFDEFVPKPFKFDALIGAIERLLNGHGRPESHDPPAPRPVPVPPSP